MQRVWRGEREGGRVGGRVSWKELACHAGLACTELNYGFPGEWVAVGRRCGPALRD